MSKLSFRARALDPSKPMPIFLAEELPDLPEYSAINRAVPQMPSGMEKEEESEHHLQRAICTGLIIPTPEVFTIDQDFFDRNYPPDYKMPRQLIHMQPLGLEQDIPDYDIDSADEVWVNQQSRRLDLTVLKFEQMMDRLEKSSGQTVITLNEAKALLKQDDEISIAVYDYWLNKRLKTQHPLILSVKTENRPGASTNNPYLAFRRRTEKMQTRKNRKNDETSYEKMLKLKRDLYRAVTLLDMVKRREKTKREQLHLSIEIVEKRYQAKDFNGSILAEISSTIRSSSNRPAFAPLYTNQYSHHSSTLSTQQTGAHLSSTAATSTSHYSTSQYLNSSSHGVADSINASSNSSSSRKEKRQYKKRKHKLSRDKQYSAVQSASPAIESTIETEEEDLTVGSHLGGGSNAGAASDTEDEGYFAFKRNKSCEYQKPITTPSGNWPWESKEDNGFGDSRFRYTLTSIRHPRPACIGFARRRMGRGGRVMLDRARTSLDNLWSQLDYTIFDSKSSNKTTVNPLSTSETGNAGSGAEIKIEITDDCDDNVSRDTMYISTSSDVISRPVKIESILSNQNPNRRAKPDENNSISNISSNLLSKEIKREILSDTEEMSEWPQAQRKQQLDDVVGLVRSHCKNNFSNSNNINNRKYINLSINNNNRTNDKFNVIKEETIVKQEAIDSTDLNILDDENVNLACLSNLINANLNRCPLSPRADFLNHSASLQSPSASSNSCTINNQPECNGDNLDLDNCDTSSPTNYFDEIVEKVRKDWLHFRPKTPPPSSDQTTTASSPSCAKVDFSEQTQIAIEMQKLGSSPPSSVFMSSLDNDSLFVTNPFSYNDLQPDEQLLFNPQLHISNSNSNSNQSNLIQPTDVSSNSGIDFNLSGDSLNELNLSLGESEDNEKMLENILQECQIDDLKALNQTTNFWNGLLDDGGNGLLDAIDEKKPIVANPDLDRDVKKSGNRKLTQCSTLGSSTFTLESSSKDVFFKKEEIRESIKMEPPDEILASPPPPPVTAVSTTTVNSSHPTQSQNHQPTGVVIQQLRQQIMHLPTQHSQQSNRLQTIVPINHQQTTKHIVTPAVTQILHAQQQLTTIGAGNQQAILASLGQSGIIGSAPQKIYIKQEPSNQVAGSLNQNAVITLANVKLENDLLTADNANPTGQQSQQMIVTAPKQHAQQFLLQQIGQNATQIINVSNSAGGLTTDVSGTFVLAGNANMQMKRNVNGPVDRNVALQNIVGRRFINRKIHSIPQNMQQVQQQQIHVVKQEDNNRSGSPKPNQAGSFIKMSSYPVVVSELNQQSAGAAVVGNHNYSLPSAQPITIINQGQAQGNKIILSTSSAPGNVSGTGNFTFTTPIQDLQNKIHYKEISASNLKLNFVTSTGNNTGGQMQQAPQGIATQQQQRIKLDKTFNMLIDPQDPKRVVYTKLVNVSTLQHKNNSGQTVQVAPIQNVNKTHSIQRPTIFTNMRSIPVSVSNSGAAMVTAVSEKSTNNANSNDGTGSVNLNTTNR